MATAARKRPRAGSSSAMSFAVYQDNIGRFHWELVGGDGRNLAISVDSFASERDAERAAGGVRDAAVVAIG